MSKAISKKIVAVLLIAVVLLTGMTVIRPETAQAASKKITLKSGKAAPATVYAGHSYNLKVAGVKVKFTTSNKKIATIGATTGKMKAVAPGRVTITAKNAKSGKVVAKKTFTVLQRAKSVAADAELHFYGIDETATVKATLTPATSTDVVRFTTADKTIATVGATSGKVTAKKYGKTTINVYAKATKATANSNTSNKVTTVTVYVHKSYPAETRLVFFDAGENGVVDADASCRELGSGDVIGSLPTISDIDVNSEEELELLGWSTSSGATEPDVSSDYIVKSDVTLYAVWGNAE